MLFYPLIYDCEFSLTSSLRLLLQLPSVLMNDITTLFRTPVVRLHGD